MTDYQPHGNEVALFEHAWRNRLPLLIKDNWVVKDQVAGEKPFQHIGVHGGVGAEEMVVPLMVAKV